MCQEVPAGWLHPVNPPLALVHLRGPALQLLLLLCQDSHSQISKLYVSLWIPTPRHSSEGREPICIPPPVPPNTTDGGNCPGTPQDPYYRLLFANTFPRNILPPRPFQLVILPLPPFGYMQWVRSPSSTIS